MSDIRKSITQLQEPEKTIGEMLIEFYETMKGLEKDSERGGKQATKIVMTISDLNSLFEKTYPVPTVEYYTLSNLSYAEYIEKFSREAIEKLYGSPLWELDSNAQNRFEGIKHGFAIGAEYARKEITK